METIIDKILGSKRSAIEQKSYLTLVISKVATPNEKIKFLMVLLEKTLHGMAEEPSFEDAISLFEFGVQNLKMMNALNFDSFLFLTSFSSQIECWCIVLGALIEPNNIEKLKNLSQIKSFFSKRLTKSSEFWHTSFLDDFFESKLSKIMSFNINTTKSDSASLNLLNVKNLTRRIEIMAEFFCCNLQIIPISVDFREILMKWILSVDFKSNQTLVNKLIDTLLRLCEYSATSLISSFKQGFKFLQFSYEETDKFKPIFSFFHFIEKLDKSQIQQLTNYSVMGVLWLNESWFSCFKNLVKLGLTENMSEIFLFVTNYLLSQKNFEVLIKVFENLVPSLFNNLLFEKLSIGTLAILERYIIGAPLNSTLIEKIIQKILLIFQKINDNNIAGKMVLISDCILKKYENVMKNADFILFLETVKAAMNHTSDVSLIQSCINSNDWLNFSKAQQQLKFRGLINLGNTCYMNSFLQCLYMTQGFRSNLLKIKFDFESSNPINKEQPQTGFSLDKLKKVAPAYQLQRLFALLFQSKRQAINPSFFRNVLPDFFRMSYIQQDASEFAKIYLDSFEMALKNTKRENLLKEIFSGEIVHEVCCQKCLNRTENKENFLDLHVNFDLNRENANVPEPELFTLSEMLEKEFSPEEMKEKDKYFCNKCNDYTPLAIKQSYLSTMPNYLILTMNRFWFDFKAQKRNKVMKYVEIPLALDFKKHARKVESCTYYELYAVLIHKGTTTEFGHYYTFSRDTQGENSIWIMFNDSNITKINSDAEMMEFIKSSKDDTPYILFYENAEEKKRRESEKEIIVLDNLLKKLIEQDNALFIKEEQMNTFNLNLMQKQIENNQSNMFSAFSKFNNKKDDEDEDQPPDNLFSGSHYIC